MITKSRSPRRLGLKFYILNVLYENHKCRKNNWSETTEFDFDKNVDFKVSWGSTFH